MTQEPLETPRGALDGIRIIDLSQVAGGPYGTSLLGDMGADVIKVEPVEGEPFRRIDTIFGPGDSAYFRGVNRSKRSITIDLAKDAGKRVLDRLVESADVFIIAFRPSATRKLGLTYERLSARNPYLVYCSLTAFGETGPRADEPGMDILAQALSGVMALTGDPDRPPVKTGPSIADFAASYLMGFAICAALRVRDRDGAGQKIELNLLDGMVASLANFVTPCLATNEPIRRAGGGHPQVVPYQVFQVSDGYIVVACLNDRFWPPLCEALEDPALREARFSKNPDRLRLRVELVGRIQAILIRHTAAHWIERLQRFSVPCSVVNELEDALADPQVVHNGIVVDIAHPKTGPYRVVGNPIRMSRTMPCIDRPVPRLGQHTRDIMKEAGYSDEEIARLADMKVVGLDQTPEEATLRGPGEGNR